MGFNEDIEYCIFLENDSNRESDSDIDIDWEDIECFILFLIKVSLTFERMRHVFFRKYLKAQLPPENKLPKRLKLISAIPELAPPLNKHCIKNSNQKINGAYSNN